MTTMRWRSRSRSGTGGACRGARGTPATRNRGVVRGTRRCGRTHGQRHGDRVQRRTRFSHARPQGSRLREGRAPSEGDPRTAPGARQAHEGCADRSRAGQGALHDALVEVRPRPCGRASDGDAQHGRRGQPDLGSDRQLPERAVSASEPCGVRSGRDREGEPPAGAAGAQLLAVEPEDPQSGDERASSGDPLPGVRGEDRLFAGDGQPSRPGVDAHHPVVGGRARRGRYGS